jgi:hypothetical protein
MPTNSIHPGFVTIDYSSLYGPHKMTIPTREPVFTVIGDDPQYEAWDASTILGSAMVHDLVALLRQILVTSMTVDGFTIYSVPAIGAPAQPIWSEVLGSAGLATTAGWSKAVQVTMSMRTTAFGAAKAVFLDVPTLNTFETTVSPASEYVDFFDELADPAKAWSGRDNARIAFLKGITITLNEELRRQYHMV